MNIVRSFCSGLLSVVHVTSAPLLYRYPHRNSGEALHSDWRRIGQDIESVIGKIEAEAHYGE